MEIFRREGHGVDISRQNFAGFGYLPFLYLDIVREVFSIAAYGIWNTEQHQPNHQSHACLHLFLLWMRVSNAA
jgi:hypothetical protein